MDSWGLPCLRRMDSWGLPVPKEHGLRGNGPLGTGLGVHFSQIANTDTYQNGNLALPVGILIFMPNRDTY